MLKSVNTSLESLKKLDQASLIYCLILLMSYEGMNLKLFLDEKLIVLFQRDTYVASYKCTWDVGDGGRTIVLHCH